MAEKAVFVCPFVSLPEPSCTSTGNMTLPRYKFKLDEEEKVPAGSFVEQSCWVQG